MQKDYWHELALSKIPDTGPILHQRLLQHFGNAQAVLKAKKKELLQVDGIGEALATKIKQWDDFNVVADELRFIEKHHIDITPIGDPNYPKKLRECIDAPILLFSKGNSSLNATKMLSIIGTRNNTIYGRTTTELLIASLPKEVVIVSGLAFGIDAIAHKAALQQGLQTFAVLAHGLNDLYPAQHKGLAREIMQQGALITEFGKTTKADKHNFPRRNRIVAGMADATIVIETAAKGGSMITADMAFHYNRDLFAVPGRINDEKSEGCLRLIEQNKAMVFTSANSLLQSLNWATKEKTTPSIQLDLGTLTEEEQKIISILDQHRSMYIDDLATEMGIPAGDFAASLLSLEMEMRITVFPGKRIALR